MCVLFRPHINLDQWYQSSSLFTRLSCMSPTRSGYKELGLKITEPLKDDPRRAQQPHMAEEKKDGGVGYPIKLLLKEALA